MGLWDFDWAGDTAKKLFNVLDKAGYAITDYAVKPVTRPVLALAYDSANVFDYLIADAYEGVFKPKEHRERLKREGAFGYLAEFGRQSIIANVVRGGDLGTGYLPAGTAGTAAMQRTFEDRAKIGKLPFTLGRGLAHPGVKLGLYSQDSWLHTAISGGVDAYKVFKNPTDVFNWLNVLKPAGTASASRVATANNKITQKQAFAELFDDLQERVLRTKEDVALTKRPLTEAEQLEAAHFNELTRRTVPNTSIDVDDPLLAGTKRSVNAYDSGMVYESLRPVVNDVLAGRLNEAGVVRDIAPYMIQNNYQRWKATAHGTEWAQELLDGVRSGELNAGQIWRTMLNREGPQAAAMLVTELKNPAATIDDVWRVLDQAVESFEPGFNLRKIGRTTIDAVRTGDGFVIKNEFQERGWRQLEMLPESTRVGLSNVAQSAKNLDNMMGSFGFDLASRNDWLSKFFVAASQSKDELFVFLREFEYVAVGDQLRQLTAPGTNKQLLDNDTIRELTSWTQKLADEVRSYTLNDVGENVPLPWIVGDGKGPLRYTQIMGDDYFIMPPRMVNEIIRITGSVGRFMEQGKAIPVLGKGFVAQDAMRKAAIAYMANYWKPARVAKPSHLVRIIPEEVLRGAASGIFEHPMEQLLAMTRWRGQSVTMGRDVLGRVVEGKIPNVVKMYKKVDDLSEKLAEAMRYQKDAAQGIELTRKQQKLVAQIDDLSKQISDLNAKIEADPQAIWDVLIGPRSRGALASATGEYAASYLQMVRRGVMQLPDKTLTSEKGAWVKGLAHQIVDMAYNQDYRRIAQQKLFDDDLININGVTKSVAGHIADGTTHPYTGQALDNDLDAVILWLFQGDGRRLFDGYFDNLANLKPGYKAGGYDNYATAAERVYTILNNDIAWITGFDQTLLDVISTGMFDGQRAVFRETTGRGKVNAELSKWIANTFINQPHSPRRVQFFPERMMTQQNMFTRQPLGVKNLWDKALRFYFEEAYGRASDFFARSPSWKANYWNRMEELVSLMTPEDAKRAVAMARKAKLTETRIERMEIQARLANGTGDLASADELSKIYAVEATNDLLYNANKRSLFGQQHRIMFGFFEAWREVTSTWLKLSAMNPRIPRNVAQFVDAQQDQGSFQTNYNGRQVFELPLTGKLAQFFIGKDRGIVRNFTVGTNAVNIALQMRPGFGPVMQVAVDQLLPNEPDYSWLREQIFPFGRTSNFETLFPLPPWVSQMAQGLDLLPGTKNNELVSDLAQWLTNYENNEYKKKAEIRAWQYLVSTYPDRYLGVDGMGKAKDEAEEIALKVTTLRGALAWAGPGAPITTWIANTEKGSINLAIVMDDLRRREDTAAKQGRPTFDVFGEWLKFWGANVWAYTGSLTESNIGGRLASREFNEWAQTNKKTIDRYPLSAGYLGPRSGDRSLDAWLEQSQAGWLKTKSLDDAIQYSQQQLGNYLYYSERDRLRNLMNPQQFAHPDVRRHMAERLNQIQSALPDFVKPGQSGAFATDRNNKQVLELRAIANNPDLQQNRTAQSLKEYFALVDQSIANTMRQNPKINIGNWTSHKDAAGLRIYIDSVLAPNLIAKNPDFRDVYEQVLSFQFVLDDE